MRVEQTQISWDWEAGNKNRAENKDRRNIQEKECKAQKFYEG